MSDLEHTPDSITITRPDDWHLHLRDGATLASVLPHSARQFGRAIVMPNLKPPVTTTAAAEAYRNRIMAALPAGMKFEPLMTLYLTNNTPPDEILRAQESGIVHAVKLYPAGATTNSDAGVTDLSNCYKTLEMMQEVGMPFLVHGEVTDQDIDLFDREAVFIERVMRPLRRDFPALNIVFEHITTKHAAVRGGSGRPDRRDHHRASPAVQPQRHLQGRHPSSLLLPAGAEARRTPPGAGHRRHQRRRALLPRHRLRAARAGRQGSRLWLRRLLHRAARDGAVRRSLRARRRAGQAGGLRQLQRPGLLQPAAQHRHHHAQARAVDVAGNPAAGGPARGAAQRRRNHQLENGISSAASDRLVASLVRLGPHSGRPAFRGRGLHGHVQCASRSTGLAQSSGFTDLLRSAGVAA